MKVMRISILLAVALFMGVLSDSHAQSSLVQIIDFETLKPRLSQKNDTLYVINFWATWCKPCVEELPYFDSLNEVFSDKKIKVLLVSLDFKSKLETQLRPFLESRNVRSEVVLLYEPNPDAWIRKVDENWQGSIPATLFVKGNKRRFYEKQFSRNQLYSLILNF